MIRSLQSTDRKRKAHQKSRKGCRNCKLRRVKCDESKPKCKNCVSFGVACNYDVRIGDLQIPGAGQLMQEEKIFLPDSINSTVVAVDRSRSLNTQSIEMSMEMMGRLYRFESRTVLELGSKQASDVYRQEIPKLVFKHPYLMHMIQTITAIHDRYLSPTPERQSCAEIHHWSMAASSFNRKLSARLEDSDYDAIWVTAAMLGVVAFASVSQTKPEESWPFKEGSVNEWLPLCQGKKTIFRIANPMIREHSFFAKLIEVKETKENKEPFFANLHCDIKNVVPAWIELFGLQNEETRETSPYYSAVVLLGRLVQMTCTRDELPQFFSFVSRIEPPFRELLNAKDARALLIMAIWFAKLFDAQWWMNQRAVLECKSIILYLEKYHGDNTAIMNQLVWPKGRCELCS